jgi:hypothetical protein
VANVLPGFTAQAVLANPIQIQLEEFLALEGSTVQRARLTHHLAPLVSFVLKAQHYQQSVHQELSVQVQHPHTCAQQECTVLEVLLSRATVRLVTGARRILYLWRVQYCQMLLMVDLNSAMQAGWTLVKPVPVMQSKTLLVQSAHLEVTVMIRVG